jgi:agmatine/peptidylarginine deiminase
MNYSFKPTLVFFVALLSITSNAQNEAIQPPSQTVKTPEEQILPIWSTPQETFQIENNLIDFSTAGSRNTTDPPQGTEVRTPGQWEELQAVIITWTSFPSIHRQLVQHIQNECEVWIVTQDSTGVKTNITSNGGSLNNVKFINAPFNSIWVRDYGPQSVYLAGVDSLALINWRYNRNRPNDNNVPIVVGEQIDIPVYSMTALPNDLVATGGNFMADGMGAAFSSNLILDENQGTGFSQSFKTEQQINTMMSQYMGLSRYIKMNTLPYDDIHHIDMHMKLMNEETLLVGEFPDNISDGPALEFNLQYVLDNFTSPFGTPYKVVRIPMVPSTTGGYPGAPYGNASYRTYANNVIVNKTVIVPTYREEYDTTGLNIIKKVMPGYNVVAIDVDQSNANLIGQGGAIHCITKDVSSADPLWIVHKNLPDTYDDMNPYIVHATIRHKSGISAATLYYKTSLTGAYSSVPMAFNNSVGAFNWTAQIPAQALGTTVYYYVQAQSNSGKIQVRPMPAPEGYFHFRVLGDANIESLGALAFTKIFPNPSAGLTCIATNFDRSISGRMYLLNQLGQEVLQIHNGEFVGGDRKYFVDVENLRPGMYMVVLETSKGIVSSKLAVK